MLSALLSTLGVIIASQKVMSEIGQIRNGVISMGISVSACEELEKSHIKLSESGTQQSRPVLVVGAVT
eukprot:6001781-Amphidinium_carterae.2